MQKYVTTKLHETIFGSDPLDAERDVFIAAKMGALVSQGNCPPVSRQLHTKNPYESQTSVPWVQRGPLRPEHLDIPDAMRDEHHIALAQKELLKMDQYKAPRDKLVCILNSCKGETRPVPAFRV